MAELEELGYISHPHTSAGRVPTDKGYRFYVDSLTEPGYLAREEKEAIRRAIENKLELDEILKDASKLLGKISKQLSIILSPQMSEGILDKLDLISISSNKILVVISIQSGLVRTIMLEVSSEIKRDKLEAVSAILNERLSGLTLRQIKETFRERVKDVSDEYVNLIHVFIHSADKLFYDFYEVEKIHIGGTPEILTQPEFNKPENFRNIIELIEDEDVIVHVLQAKARSDRITVSIGQENPDEKLKNYSLITSRYKIGDVTGTVGLIGPKRMNYAKMIAIVDYASKVLSEALH
jgi:heat-inducible transcriptional repressor